jgi:hypothetical protein
MRPTPVGRIFLQPDQSSLNMTKLISLALFVGGIILIAYGASASDSVGSSFSRLFTGSPTDKTMWLIIGGAVATVLGASGLLRSSRTP